MYNLLDYNQTKWVEVMRFTVRVQVNMWISDRNRAKPIKNVIRYNSKKRIMNNK
jgi:hypothetical protein